MSAAGLTDSGGASSGNQAARPHSWLREPLVYFLLAGLVLFGIYRLVNPDAFARPAGNRIVLTDDDLRQMSVQWMAQGRPQPTPEQWRSLIDTKVREEVLYREALALGLDRDDTIVKRRLAQKMEFLAEDVSSLREPTPAELREWFAGNATRFALPPRATFRHIYFSPDKRGTNARADAERALGRLAGKPADAPEIAAAGDAYMFQDYYGDQSSEKIAAQLGPPFARALFAQKPGAWSGPIESGFGWHLVFVESMTPGRVPAFEEIEPDVKQEWQLDRRQEVRRRMFDDMRARYEVVLPPSLAGDAAPALSGTAAK